MSIFKFKKPGYSVKQEPPSPSTCKHAQLDIEVVRGRCKVCGMEVKTAQMKKVIANDQKTLYSMGFKAGYLKAGEDAKRPAVPIAIPASVLEAEAAEVKAKEAGA